MSFSLCALDFTCIIRNADGTEVSILSSEQSICREQENIDNASCDIRGSIGVTVTIPVPNGKSVQGSFFNRSSDTLLVIGSGFGKPREMARYYANVFHNYDVLLFDYHWKNNSKDFLLNIDTLKSPMAALFDMPKVEVASVVRFGRSLKGYKKVVGLGVCYSAYQFIAAQAEAVAKHGILFDALIIDSCPLSVSDVQRQVFGNITLLFRPLQGTQPGLLQHLWCKTGIPDMLAWLSSRVTDYSVLPLCTQLADTPVLCIHGTADRLVLIESFEVIWDHIQYPRKMALITPNSHVLNIRCQAVYKVVCDQFISIAV